MSLSATDALNIFMRRRDERARHLQERIVIELLPSLNGEFGRLRGNAIGGLDRLLLLTRGRASTAIRRDAS